MTYVTILVMSLLALPTFFFFFFLGLHLQHMEVFRQGVESELQLPAYTGTAMPRSKLPLQPTLQLMVTPGP